MERFRVTGFSKYGVWGQVEVNTIEMMYKNSYTKVGSIKW